MLEKRRYCSRIHVPSRYFPLRPQISSSPLPCLPTFSPLMPAHHPPALCTPPQKSSDSWKVLGVYSVTTKQNHLKTKWARECAGAIRPLSLCGRREKRPLRAKGTGEEGGGEQRVAHYFSPRVSPYPPTQSRFYRPLSTPHAPRLLSAPFKGEHAIWDRAVCVTVPPRTRRFHFSPSLLFFSLIKHFLLLSSHIRV